MKVSCPQVETARSSPAQPLRLLKPGDVAQRHLPRIEWRDRRGPALHLSPFGDGEEVLSLNLATGCVHRCAFCSVRAYPSYPGDDVLQLFRDNAGRLDAELSSRKTRPRAVYVSPATDPFPPLNEVQEEAAGVAAVLARHGVEAWFMTRGYIRPTALSALTMHGDLVKVTVGMSTMERSLQRVLEPLGAPPRLRLRQLAELRRLGIGVQVGIEPLIHGLTDTRANLEELLDALATVGVCHVSAGYLFLREGIREHLQQALAPHGWEHMLQAYAGGPTLRPENVAPARYLPKGIRQRGYAALMSLAAGLGITVSVSQLTNPDFRAARRAEAEPRSRQLRLPMF